MDKQKVLEILDKICDCLIENEEILTELDRKIGDGDHGINIKRGFSEVKKNLLSYNDKTIDQIFNAIGFTLMSKVGGSSGPLLASAFMKAGKEDNLLDMLKASYMAIEARGKAKLGEKTMLDVLIPTTMEYEKSINLGLNHSEAMKNVLKTSKEALDYTKSIPATKGRASYLGQRSIGTEDPGAYTMYLILSVIERRQDDWVCSCKS